MPFLQQQTHRISKLNKLHPQFERHCLAAPASPTATPLKFTVEQEPFVLILTGAKVGHAPCMRTLRSEKIAFEPGNRQPDQSYANCAKSVCFVASGRKSSPRRQ